MRRTLPLTFMLLLVAATAGSLWMPREARACGCFAPPSPAQPVVQAGERIVFAHDAGRIIAHIEIQYEGSANEFAWLVPVPSRPELRLGSEQTFAALERMSAPRFLLDNTAGCGGGPSFGCSDFESALSSAEVRDEDPGVSATFATAGPYDYAIIEADAKQPLVDWLNDNRFFVPTEVADVLDPYVRAGSYFLALKLRAGESVGSLQPVVLEYEAELPMIPIVLTSASAVRDMGVLVWVLGEDRAIPQNYSHVSINEQYIDWFRGAQNYGEVVARAVDEADNGHGFVTEYAGSSANLRMALDSPGRFPAKSVIEAVESASELRQRINTFVWPMQIVEAVLDRYPSYDAQAVADELWERIVEPAREAQQMFDTNPYLTRLFTTLDPSEMTRDPVFAFNPDLPAVNRLHRASFDSCDGSGTLSLSDGREYRVEDNVPVQDRFRGAPRAEIISVMRLEGPPEIVVDNRELLFDLDDGGGCRTLGRGFGRSFDLLFLFAVVVLGRRRWRRR